MNRFALALAVGTALIAINGTGAFVFWRTCDVAMPARIEPPPRAPVSSALSVYIGAPIKPPAEFVPHYTPADEKDTARLLIVSDHLMVASMAVNGCSEETAKKENHCITAIGEYAGAFGTTYHHDVLIGPWAGYKFTTESDRVVMTPLFECDVVVRKCWYLSSWRLRPVESAKP